MDLKLSEISDNIINKAFPYTNGQLEAIDKILKWSKGSDYTPFTLSGFAGTGKTTISKDIVRNIVGKVACTAPTHKAARISANAIGVETTTIHSLLGLRPNLDLENFDSNNPTFAIIAAGSIRKYTHLIVEECSQIGDKNSKGQDKTGLFTLITTECLRYKVKLLFIGDPHQLSPIGEIYSKTFMIDNVYHLTEIVRQDESNSIIPLLRLARNDVKYRTSKVIELLSKRISKHDANTDNGYVIANDSHFATLMHDRFASNSFETNVDYCRHLAFTNDAVSGTNNYIRNALFNNPTEVIIKDDLFTSYSSLFDEFTSPIIVNSEDYIINSIMNYNNKYLLSGYLVSLRKINGGDITSDMFIVDHSNMDNVRRYVTIIESLLAATKTSNPVQRRNAWAKFYEFKDYNVLLVNLYKHYGNIVFSKVPESKLISSKDLDYGFGMTVHKSQGSTFNNVFVNLKDILYTKNGIPYRDINLRNRLIYVAFSRAKDNLFIYL